MFNCLTQRNLSDETLMQGLNILTFGIVRKHWHLLWVKLWNFFSFIITIVWTDIVSSEGAQAAATLTRDQGYRELCGWSCITGGLLRPCPLLGNFKNAAFPLQFGLSLKTELLENSFRGEDLKKKKTLLFACIRETGFFSCLSLDILFCVWHLLGWLYFQKQKQINGKQNHTSASLNLPSRTFNMCPG